MPNSPLGIIAKVKFERSMSGSTRLIYMGFTTARRYTHKMQRIKMKKLVAKNMKKALVWKDVATVAKQKKSA